MTTNNRPLTPKQRAFCQAYLETGNQSEAYRLAYNAEGMSGEAVAVEASRLMDHPTVALRIREAHRKLAAKHEITAEKVLDKLADTAFAETADLPSHSERTRALELLGKRLNLFSEKSESSLTITHELAAPLAELSVEELKALAARGRPKVLEGEYREAEDES